MISAINEADVVIGHGHFHGLKGNAEIAPAGSVCVKFIATGLTAMRGDTKLTALAPKDPLFGDCPGGGALIAGLACLPG